jgi:hypothetical protein
MYSVQAAKSVIYLAVTKIQDYFQRCRHLISHLLLPITHTYLEERAIIKRILTTFFELTFIGLGILITLILLGLHHIPFMLHILYVSKCEKSKIPLFYVSSPPPRASRGVIM